MKIDCDRLAALLPEFFDGALSYEESDAALDHLATCDACRLTVEELEGVRSLAGEHGRLQMSADARQRIRRSIGLG